MAEETQNTVKAVPKGLTPWQPGCPSPNPGGRPKGLATYIREKTKDGQELVNLLLAVAKGDESKFCKWADRLKAIEMLLDRGGWPKAPIVLDPTSQALPILDVKSLTEEEIKSFEHFGLVLASIRQRLAGGTPEAQS